MTMETTNHEGESETETSIIDVRTRDLSEFEEGEPVRIHYRDAEDEPHKCITGRVAMHYSDRKALIETEEGQKLVVDLSDVTEENLRDFDTDEYLGRAMFAESAWEPEQDGEDLREELLGDGGEEETDDDDDDEPDGHVCPECGGNVTVDEMMELTDEEGNSQMADTYSCEDCGAGGAIGTGNIRTGIFADEGETVTRTDDDGKTPEISAEELAETLGENGAVAEVRTLTEAGGVFVVFREDFYDDDDVQNHVEGIVRDAGFEVDTRGSIGLSAHLYVTEADR